MTTLSPRLLAVVCLTATVALTGCSLGDPTPDPTTTEQAVLEIDGAADGEGSTSGTSDAGGSDGGGPLTADGMPLDGVLEGCEELVDDSVTTTDFDIQWEWEFECRSRAPFDATVAGLDAHPSLSHTQNAILGSGDYVSDRHHWIGEIGGQVIDVDLKLTGEVDDFEMTYLVTLRTDG